MPRTSDKLTFKHIRIIFLLSVLIFVAIASYFQQTATTNWEKPIYVSFYAINGDRSDSIENFITGLKPADYQEVFDFLVSEAKAFELNTLPTFYSDFGEPVAEAPPKPPAREKGVKGVLKIAKWSLGLRYWLFKNTGSLGLDSRHIRLFIIYHTGQTGQALAHSYGLRKGLVGVVHAYARPNMKKRNNIVIAHELLHTLGASDKYSVGGYPVYPDGFAEPETKPLFPQRLAEIMAGRIPLTESDAIMPKSLSYCLVGPLTAKEIKWY